MHTRHRRKKAPSIQQNYIQRLSTELLVAIFIEIFRDIARIIRNFAEEYAVFHGDEEWEDSVQMPRTLIFWTPMDLLPVCRLWFNICTTHHVIWSQIIVPFIGDAHHRCYGTLYMPWRLQKCLEASGTAKLDIMFITIDEDIYSSTHSTVFNTCQSYIWREVARWRTADILQVPNRSHVIWHHLPLPPSIASIRLSDGTIDSWDNSIRHGPSSLRHWQTLTSVSLSIRASFTYPIPLKMLSNLQKVNVGLRRCDFTRTAVSKNTLHYALSLVAGSGTLKYLRISITSMHPSTSRWRAQPENTGPSSFQCHLPALETLILDGYTETGPRWAPFLICLLLPSLLHLNMTEPAPLCLGESLRRWGAKLLSLSVTMRPIPGWYDLPDDLLPALKHATYLELFAYGKHRSYVILDQIADSNIMPRLREVSFGILFNEGYIAEGEKALIGFDYATSVLYLLEERPSIRKIRGAFTCSTVFASGFNAELQDRCQDYDITLYSEGMKAFALKKDFPILQGRVDSDGVFYTNIA